MPGVKLPPNRLRFRGKSFSGLKCTYHNGYLILPISDVLVDLVATKGFSAIGLIIVSPAETGTIGFDSTHSINLDTSRG